MLKARLPKVHLVIDHAGNKVGALGVNDCRIIRRRYVNTLYSLALDDKVALYYGSFVDDACVYNSLIHYCIFTSASISTGTLKGN